MKTDDSTYTIASPLPVPAIADRGARGVLAIVSDYIALTKPRLVSLVLLTTAVGYIVASGVEVAFWGLVHILVSTAMVAGGGAALNQFFERFSDARMPRTASRPLAAARLNERTAVAFGSGLIIGGLCYMAVLLNPLTALLGLLSASLYVLVYTPLKRVTPWCVGVGAIVGALPPVMGWAAASGTLAAGAVAFFVIMFVWQMPHFLAIAWMYRDEYASARLAIVRLTDAEGTHAARRILWLNLFLIPLTLLPSFLGMAGLPYTVFALFLGAGFAAIALRTSRTLMASYARRVFYASLIYLPVLFVLLAVFRL